ncbi:MAG TPA: adenylate/guanylate cyclase domain-containing protein, partial [Candidatus Binatia bacterium]|nr:adenylate/guanylate cyclase domain-containing protein [Candidatus Binatia bacterium]
LIVIGGSISNQAVLFEDASYRAFCDRLAAFSRLVVFDKRGMGLSDRVETGGSMEERMDDVRAVLDAIGSTSAVLLGISEGGLMATLFAATYPERTRSLILLGAETNERNDEEWHWGDGTPEEFEASMADWSGWGSGRSVAHFVPRLAGDPEAEAWWGRLQLMSGTPRTIEAHMRASFATDTRPILGTVRVPTLVMHRTDDRTVSVEQGRYIAAHIPGARYIELLGDVHPPWVDGDDLLAEIEEFVTGERPLAEADRVLATVLFSDIVGSTERASVLGDHGWTDLLARHREAVRRQLSSHRGMEVDTAGDGFLATFDGPSRAVRCGLAIHDAMSPLDLRVRIGLHTGEVERHGDSLGGIAVHIGARVASLAGAGETLVSSTVRDLSAGSGIRFEDRGFHALKGVPDEWRIYAAK